MVFVTLAAMAWRNLWRHARRSLITASAMAVAAAMCMALIALNDGAYTEIHRILVDQKLGHVVVEHPDYPARRQVYDTVTDAAGVLGAIERTPGVRAVNARLQGHGLVGAGDNAVGGQLIGVLPGHEEQTTRIHTQVERGQWLAPEANGEVVVGVGLAQQLGVEPGAELVVVTQAADGSTGNALYTVRGVLRTGETGFDRGGVMMHLHELQELMVLPDQVHRITALVHEGAEIPAVSEAIARSLPDALQVQPWWVASPGTAQMVQMQRVGAGAILLIVFIVAAFGVINTMTMSVFERTRELGVLRALGMRGGSLVALVVLESLFLGALAAALGGALGGLLDLYLVVYGLDLTGGESFSFSGVDLDPVMRGRVEPGGVLLVLGSVVGVSVLASLWPAWRATRLRPVDAIRST